MKNQRARLIPSPNGFSLLIILLLFLAYWPVVFCDFFFLDDFVYLNPTTEAGFSLQGLELAFTSHLPYWQPVSYISHMLVTTFFGMAPSAHHIANLAIHALNSLVLFHLLRKMTGATWQSGLAASLFALHPVNVESVVWIAERNMLLATLFGFLSIDCYAGYVRQAKRPLYGLSFLCFALSVMSKPIFMTLPFVLILLDYWPFDRLSFFRHSSSSRQEWHHQPVPASRLLIEKVPFFLLTAASLFLSLVLAQQDFVTIAKVPLDIRLFNALAAYVDYMRRFFWPHPLAVIYPFPEAIPLWQIVGSAAALAAVSLLVLRHMKRKPHLFVGWFWYTGVFLPVIGIVQAGLWSASADRFAYLPYVGIGVMVAYSLPKTMSVFREKLLAAAAGGVMVAWLLTANAQISHWVDSKTMLQHTLTVTKKNYIAHLLLAQQYKEDRRMAAAVAELEKAIAIKPNYVDAYFELSLVHTKAQHYEKALKYAQKTIDLHPYYADAYANLGAIYIYLNQVDAALEQLIQAIRIEPAHADALNNIGFLLMQRGNYAKAIDLFKKSLASDPEDLQARLNLMASEKMLAEQQRKSASTFNTLDAGQPGKEM